MGATSVHLCCGIFGTICIGLFAQEGVTSLSARNGLFFGGGFGLLGTQLVGIAAVAVFGFLSTSLVWLVLKKTVGIRVAREEELAGLDIGEHGNIAYPDFAPAASASVEEFSAETGEDTESVSAAVLQEKGERMEEAKAQHAVPVIHKERQGAMQVLQTDRKSV